MTTPVFGRPRAAKTGDCRASSLQFFVRPTTRLGPASCRGFTLLELLVAVAILAIALLAAFKALGQSGNVLREGQLRQVAAWVAENQAAALRARRAFPSPNSRDEGEEEQGQVRYAWHNEFKPTANADFLRVETSVAAADRPDQELARLTSFLRRGR
jgi:general secretion pathway protein I